MVVSMLASTFSETKALWKPNMVWFVSLQGTNNFTNIWLHWRTSTTVTLHGKQTSTSFFLKWHWFCRQESSGSQQLPWRRPGRRRPAVWISHWPGGRWEHIWNEKSKKRNKETKSNTLGQNQKPQKWQRFGGDSTQDQTKVQEKGLSSDPRPWAPAERKRPAYQVLGSCSDDFSLLKC